MGEEIVEVTSYYPAEEREFGPIMPEFRGPVELSLYGSWNFFSPTLDMVTGGALFGGARVTANFGEQGEVGAELDWTVSRFRFHQRGLRTAGGIGSTYATVRSLVTVHTATFGATFRLTFLRSGLLTPFVRFGVGMVYFDAVDTTAQISGGTTPIKLDSSTGLAVVLGAGFDYKLAKNWSFRFETGGSLWMTDWREGDGTYEAEWVANSAQIGIVWHFQ